MVTRYTCWIVQLAYISFAWRTHCFSLPNFCYNTHFDTESKGPHTFLQRQVYMRQSHKMRFLTLFGILLFTVQLACARLPAIAAREKQRVIVLTDVANEPDDEESFVRLLLYANELDIECIVATTSVWLKDAIHPEKLFERVEAYRQVHPNLLRHAEGYPEPDALRAKIKRGRVAFGMQGVGDGKSTEASRAIAAVLEKEDPRPVWVTVWGGALDLGQALWDIRKEHGANETARIISKLRVYDIAGQNDTGQWICHNFPKLKYIRNIIQFKGISQRHNSPVPVQVTGPNLDCISHAWVRENVRSHGPLGPLYPFAAYKYEGDVLRGSWLDAGDDRPGRFGQSHPSAARQHSRRGSRCALLHRQWHAPADAVSPHHHRR